MGSIAETEDLAKSGCVGTSAAATAAAEDWAAARAAAMAACGDMSGEAV